MPDPKVALPVKTELRLGKHVVVDANGRRLPDTGAYDDEGTASTVAGQINDAWSKAKKDRRAKGSPEVTEESHLERALADIDESFLRRSPLSRVQFDPARHGRNRLGEFSRMIANMHDQNTRLELPHGMSVEPGRRGHVTVHTDAGKKTFRSPEVAAVHALGALDMHEIRSGRPSEKTSQLHLGELHTASRAALARGDMAGWEHAEDMKRSLRGSRSVKGIRSAASLPTAHIGRTRTSRQSPVASYGRNRPAGHPLAGARRPNTSASKGARNIIDALRATRPRLAEALAELDEMVLAPGRGLPTAQHIFHEVDHPRANGKFARKLHRMQPGDTYGFENSSVQVRRTVDPNESRSPMFGYTVSHGAMKRPEFYANHHEAAKRALELRAKRLGR